ncbi:hypothetical protein BH24ACT15_BH24ACT15_00780 [soil metagenome]
MESVQTMRWILVNMTAAAAVVAAVLGYWVPALILMLGVAAHTTHWLLHRRADNDSPPASVETR